MRAAKPTSETNEQRVHRMGKLLAQAVQSEPTETGVLRCPPTDRCPQCALASGLCAADVAFAPYAPSWDPEGRPVVALTEQMAQGRCEYDRSQDEESDCNDRTSNSTRSVCSGCDCGFGGRRQGETEETSEASGVISNRHNRRRVRVLLTVNPHMRSDGIYGGDRSRQQVFAVMGGAIGAALISRTAFGVPK